MHLALGGTRRGDIAGMYRGVFLEDTQLGTLTKASFILRKSALLCLNGCGNPLSAFVALCVFVCLACAHLWLCLCV